MHTMEYYSALKRNKVLIYGITWNNLEDIMPSEINQSQKDKYTIFISQNHKDKV